MKKMLDFRWHRLREDDKCTLWTGTVCCLYCKLCVRYQLFTLYTVYTVYMFLSIVYFFLLNAELQLFSSP